LEDKAKKYIYRLTISFYFRNRDGTQHEEKAIKNPKWFVVVVMLRIVIVKLNTVFGYNIVVAWTGILVVNVLLCFSLDRLILMRQKLQNVFCLTIPHIN